MPCIKTVQVHGLPAIKVLATNPVKHTNNNFRGKRLWHRPISRNTLVQVCCIRIRRRDMAWRSSTVFPPVCCVFDESCTCDSFLDICRSNMKVWARRCSRKSSTAVSFAASTPVRAVQVEHITLTPCVESARFQLLESNALSKSWFQTANLAPLHPEPQRFARSLQYTPLGEGNGGKVGGRRRKVQGARCMLTRKLTLD